MKEENTQDYEQLTSRVDRLEREIAIINKSTKRKIINKYILPTVYIMLIFGVNFVVALLPAYFLSIIHNLLAGRTIGWITITIMATTLPIPIFINMIINKIAFNWISIEDQYYFNFLSHYMIQVKESLMIISPLLAFLSLGYSVSHNYHFYDSSITIILIVYSVIVCVTSFNGTFSLMEHNQ
ncbi:hypothetical protein [Fructobacillus tropaeoli]|uniref:Uncharacterized protein n=1 Tax=Fructobacillus tropaeoli TaxID=709323 RepID=A0ABN9YKJ3_9LACO|nr:unnamed protein product [Fructobacillus tropaeoli]CAK1234243.1 unnamed protein product [Fructobacillus tropaeoli]